MNRITRFAALIVPIVLVAQSSFAQRPEQPASQGARPAQERPNPNPPFVSDDAYLKWRLQPSEQAYATIDGRHLKEYVNDQTAISRRYRDNGHPQFWGRIIGTEADAENGRWMLEKFRKIGLSDVREQSFDLPPQWMPHSWAVSATLGETNLQLNSAQPTYRTEPTPAAGLDLEAVDVGLGTEGDLAGRDLHGKAAFFYSVDLMSRHSTISNGAIKRIGDAGAAAIFVILAVPGNVRTQFYPVGSQVPSFSLGLADGLAVREMIGRARGAQPPHIKIRLDVKTVPNLKTATIWGSLPGTTDETVFIIAHRDGWFEGANDNATGVATMLGLAEYFARIPKEKRRRTIMFLGTSGHHDGSAMSGKWLIDNKEVFAKTAAIINCEHTAADSMVLYNGVVRKTNTASPVLWHVGGSSRLEEIVVKAFGAFGVATYSVAERAASGEIGRYQQFAPALQVIDTGLYWHSDYETSALIPPTGLEAVTRAYAMIITEMNGVDLKDLQRPGTPSEPGK